MANGKRGLFGIIYESDVTGWSFILKIPLPVIKFSTEADFERNELITAWRIGAVGIYIARNKFPEKVKYTADYRIAWGPFRLIHSHRCEAAHG